MTGAQTRDLLAQIPSWKNPFTSPIIKLLGQIFRENLPAIVNGGRLSGEHRSHESGRVCGGPMFRHFHRFDSFYTRTLKPPGRPRPQSQRHVRHDAHVDHVADNLGDMAMTGTRVVRGDRGVRPRHPPSSRATLEENAMQNVTRLDMTK
jgi:hypothetical protein